MNGQIKSEKQKRMSEQVEKILKDKNKKVMDIQNAIPPAFAKYFSKVN